MRAHDGGIYALARRIFAGEPGAAGAVLDATLVPAEWLYHAGVAARNRAYDHGALATVRVSIPVVSVGNVAVGGTGKTPFAQYVARRLREMGSSPAILHGGYAEDEPALHRAWSPDIPVLVGRDRVRSAQRAQQQGADVVVLDDGFQHRRLARDLDIVLVAAERWTRAYRLLPRGPWREPRNALRRAGIVVVTRKTASRDVADDVCRALAEYGVSTPGVVHLAPAGWAREGAAAPPPQEPALAVAALAEPSLFVDNATSAGARIRAVRAYADHHDYSVADARDILDAAGSAPIVTTEKDWVKLRRVLRAEQVWILMQRVQIEAGEDVLNARLRALVSAESA